MAPAARKECEIKELRGFAGLQGIQRFDEDKGKRSRKTTR
jgi:hypothetical protein